MPKRFSINILVLLYILDVLLTAGALDVAAVARYQLPFGEQYPPGREIYPPLGAYLGW